MQPTVKRHGFLVPPCLQHVAPAIYLAADAVLTPSAMQAAPQLESPSGMALNSSSYMPPLIYNQILLFQGPFNDVPEQAVTAVMDLAASTRLLLTTPKATLLFHQMVGL